MKRLVIVLVILVGLFLLYKLVTYTERSFSKVEIDRSTALVYNTTNQSFMDSIIYVGLSHMNIHGVTVIIRPLLDKKGLLGEDKTLKAHIVGADKVYVIYIDHMTRGEALTVLAHELIHLSQYHNGKLKIFNNTVTWETKKASVKEWLSIEYERRPWENEAFKLQGDLRSHISNVLYQ